MIDVHRDRLVYREKPADFIIEGKRICMGGKINMEMGIYVSFFEEINRKHLTFQGQGERVMIMLMNAKNKRA